MITLWRVDAIHDLGGELTHLFEESAPAAASAEQLRRWGWWADAYPEPIERAPPATIHELTSRPHPIAPMPVLVARVWLDTLEDAEEVRQADQSAEQLERLLTRMRDELSYVVIRHLLTSEAPPGDVGAEASIQIMCDL